MAHPQSPASADGPANNREPDNSARHVLKATLVPINLNPSPDSQAPRHGLFKFDAIRQFGLQPGETDDVHNHIQRVDEDHPSMWRRHIRTSDDLSITAETFDVLRAFEDPLIPALRPGIAKVALIPADELKVFADALIDLREQRLRAAQRKDLQTSAGATSVAQLITALNTAVVAARGFDVNTTVSAIGMLNLERIEMRPDGIQRGELIATIPLAPGEETAVTHKEWSVTSKEFTTIVTDSLEEYSETGVTDNTDLSQSTASQTQHSNQANVTATVQGGVPIISGSSSLGFTAQDSESESATKSIKHASSITRKASARSRKEHKTTISTKTVTGTSESSTRVLRNTGTDPIRIDYFSLMRKWRVGLYRYGLRLTYDVVIPEPGATPRRVYAQLDNLRSQQRPFNFPVRYSDIAIENAHGIKLLADQYQIALKPPPTDPPPYTPPSVRGDGSRSWSYLDIEFDVPPGTKVRKVLVSAHIGKNDGTIIFDVMGSNPYFHRDSGGDALDLHDEEVLNFLVGQTGHVKVSFFPHHSDKPWVGLKLLLAATDDAKEQWRTEVWNALYNAAQTKYYAEQQDIAGRIAALEDLISNVDTLTLRREESDEIMKAIMRMIRGRGFDFTPPAVSHAFDIHTPSGAVQPADLTHGTYFEDQSPGSSIVQWAPLRLWEDQVRFVNEAIEWENVVTFLYSYFWDVPESWDFIRQITHPDKTRQAFLRAGSARVVLTVRKGWEKRWIRFTEDGVIDSEEPANVGGQPYMTIAQDIAAYDDRNYPGIPPANPGKSSTRLQEAVYATSSSAVSAGENVSIPVDSGANFVAGLPVIVDEGKAEEEPRITAILDDDKHVVVNRLKKDHDGTNQPFRVLQPGEKGTLIAEWYEYTPSSGTDIAVTSNLTEIV